MANSKALGTGGRKSAKDLKIRVKTAKGRKVASTIWLERQLNDPYVAQARAEGYRSRAAFKIKEMNEKQKFFKRGNRVVDLGAAPGGWSQVAAAAVGSTDANPLVVGIDYLDMDPIPGVILFKKDFTDDDAPEIDFRIARSRWRMWRRRRGIRPRGWCSASAASTGCCWRWRRRARTECTRSSRPCAPCIHRPPTR